MKNYLILNSLYNICKEINEKTFIGLIEGVKDEKQALNRARAKFNLGKESMLTAEECFIQV
jgi:DNA polymerase IIIc chi subunit